MKKYCVFLLLTLCFSFRLDAKWTKSKDTIGGRINCFASCDNRIFAGAFSSESGISPGVGVYYSDNNGENWTHTLHSHQVWYGSWDVNVSCLAVFNKHIFAGDYGNGIFMSNDNGENWTITKFPTEMTARQLAVGGNNLFAVIDLYGLLRYNENATNDWGSVHFWGNADRVRNVATIGDKIYAGTGGDGIFFSEDNGDNWTPVNNGLSDLHITRLLSTDYFIFAWTPSGVFRLVRGGTYWMPVEFDDLSTDTELNYIVGNGSNYYIATNKGVYVSKDYGSSCTQVNEGLDNLNVWELLLTNSHLVASTADGVYSMPLSSVTEVEEIPTPSVFISPQPLKNEAIVTISVIPANAGISIELYDLKGTIVATYNFTSLSEGTNKLRLDVSNIPSGMYNAVIKSGVEVHNAKLIKVE